MLVTRTICRVARVIRDTVAYGRCDYYGISANVSQNQIKKFLGYTYYLRKFS